MPTTSLRHAMPDTYFRLVKRFPLTRIRDDAHLREAMAFLDALLTRDLDTGEEDYLDVLTDLVESHEAQHAVFPETSPADVLRELMRVNNLTQPQLSRETGIAQSTISAVLNGRRNLTLEQAGRLAGRFRLTRDVFLPRPDDPGSESRAKTLS